MNSDLLSPLTDGCQTCRGHAPLPPRPDVGHQSRPHYCLRPPHGRCTRCLSYYRECRGQSVAMHLLTLATRPNVLCDPQVAKRLRQTAHNLGDACINLVYTSADVQMNPDDPGVKRELAEQTKSVTEKVGDIIMTSSIIHWSSSLGVLCTGRHSSRGSRNTGL